MKNNNIIKSNKKVFKHTTISNLFLNSLIKQKLRSKILDLGCGSRYSASNLLKSNKLKSNKSKIIQKKWIKFKKKNEILELNI